jgi:hypothetical protein
MPSECTGKRTPFWLVGLAFACLAFVLLMAWLSLPLPGAILATTSAAIAFEAGNIGTHWYRDNRDAQ